MCIHRERLVLVFTEDNSYGASRGTPRDVRGKLTVTVTPDDRSSVVIVKQFLYRGGTRRWSNRYHFEGTVPPDSAHWTTLCDAIVAAEKAVIEPADSIVEAIGYDSASASPTNPHGDAVFTKDYSTAGTFAPGMTDAKFAGDSAALVRYATLARSSRNHPVYLFNYYHGGWRPTDENDTLAPAYKTALETYATAWLTGFSDGTGDKQRCGPHGAGAVSREVNPFVRHRDFPA